MSPEKVRNRFENRIALVTGAGSGIGKATAIQLAAEGAIVFAADLDANATRSTAREAGPNARPLSLDVTKEADWDAALSTLSKEFGRLDVLVNSAGVSAGSPLVEMTLQDWRRVLAVNLDGSFLAVRAGLKAMGERGGSIVLVSSASGIKAAAGAAAYSASKAGVCMLAKAAAKECRDKGIPVRINTVCPAGVKTPMWTTMPFFQDLVASTGSEEAAFAKLAAHQGGSFAEPQDIVAAILFLASEDARFVTGTDLLIDAGYTL